MNYQFLLRTAMSDEKSAKVPVYSQNCKILQLFQRIVILRGPFRAIETTRYRDYREKEKLSSNDTCWSKNFHYLFR